MLVAGARARLSRPTDRDSAKGRKEQSGDALRRLVGFVGLGDRSDGDEHDRQA